MADYAKTLVLPTGCRDNDVLGLLGVKGKFTLKDMTYQ